MVLMSTSSISPICPQDLKRHLCNWLQVCRCAFIICIITEKSQGDRDLLLVLLDENVMSPTPCRGSDSDVYRLETWLLRQHPFVKPCRTVGSYWSEGPRALIEHATSTMLLSSLGIIYSKCCFSLSLHNLQTRSLEENFRQKIQEFGELSQRSQKALSQSVETA